MTHVITVSNQKGGCGKTTSVVSLASALAVRGYTVTVVDCDGQTNATQAFGIDSEALDSDQYSVVDAYLSQRPADEIEIQLKDRFEGRLYLVPGHRGISSVGVRFSAHINEQLATQSISDLDADNIKDDQRHRLKKSIDALRGKRDFVFIDTPPEVGLPLTTSIIAADHYLVPVIPSGFDVRGLGQLLRSVEQIKGRYRPDLDLLGVLLCKVKRTKLDEQIRDYLESNFDPKDIFKTEIGDSVRHREAPLYGLTIHEHAAGESASENYLSLAGEVLERLGNPAPIGADSALELTTES